MRSKHNGLIGIDGKQVPLKQFDGTLTGPSSDLISKSNYVHINRANSTLANAHHIITGYNQRIKS